MPSRAMATVSRPLALTPDAGFDLHGLRIFTSIPDHRDFGIAALMGMVAVYDEKLLHTEGIIEGGFYVRESQHPHSGLGWEGWLQHELRDSSPRSQPRSPLKTRREVVRAIRWPYKEQWSLRLSSGYVDGPYHDWAFGSDFVGRVVGIYHPAGMAPRTAPDA